MVTYGSAAAFRAKLEAGDLAMAPFRATRNKRGKMVAARMSEARTGCGLPLTLRRFLDAAHVRTGLSRAEILRRALASALS